MKYAKPPLTFEQQADQLLARSTSSDHSAPTAYAVVVRTDAERRPIAWERLRQTFARPDYAKEAAGIAEGVELLDDVAMELGQLSRSSAVIGAGPELPAAARPDVGAVSRARARRTFRRGTARRSICLVRVGSSSSTTPQCGALPQRVRVQRSASRSRSHPSTPRSAVRSGSARAAPRSCDPTA